MAQNVLKNYHTLSPKIPTRHMVIIIIITFLYFHYFQKNSEIDIFHLKNLEIMIFLATKKARRDFIFYHPLFCFAFSKTTSSPLQQIKETADQKFTKITKFHGHLKIAKISSGCNV